MRSSAVRILKREFEKSFIDIEMIRKKSATEIIKTLISLLETNGDNNQVSQRFTRIN